MHSGCKGSITIRLFASSALMLLSLNIISYKSFRAVLGRILAEALSNLKGDWTLFEYYGLGFPQQQRKRLVCSLLFDIPIWQQRYAVAEG
jgi:hypothetical protein